MSKLKSARHHWWPESVSEFWKDERGVAHWLLPDAELRSAPPKNFGAIGNGHHIKLGKDPSQPTVWDHSFEAEFQAADDAFPQVIQWLETLEYSYRAEVVTLRDRFISLSASDDQLLTLFKCIVSLAVRSPKTREQAVSVAERLQGPLPEKDRNPIIGLNMRHGHRTVVESVKGRGKYVAIYSPDREFIFGDGFFHNIVVPVNNVFSLKILVPVTPRISVLYARPRQYYEEPKLCSLTVAGDEADTLNHAVQVYARNAIFFRSEQPTISDAFRSGRHLCYSGRNAIDELIDAVPGVTPHNQRFLFG